MRDRAPSWLANIDWARVAEPQADAYDTDVIEDSNCASPAR
jgi:hypothetical protein